MKIKEINCSRCGGYFGGEDYINKGILNLSINSAFDRLCGGKYGSGDIVYSHIPPPLLVDSGPQKLSFEWDSRGEYRLCERCHTILVGIIGEFFGFAKRGNYLEERREPSHERRQQIERRGILFIKRITTNEHQN